MEFVRQLLLAMKEVLQEEEIEMNNAPSSTQNLF